MTNSKHPDSWSDPSNSKVKTESLVESVGVVGEYEEYLNHLETAERSLSRAMDCLYKGDGVKRGLGYRVRVGRAQNIAMTLLVRELNHKEGYKNGAVHEWEQVGLEWECVYCERRVAPLKFGKRLVFGPDVARRVPMLGRKWRCNG